MKLQDILTLDCTICAAPASSKKRLFDTICDAASRKLPEINQHDLLQSLTQREQMGSTGIGNGIAIPHGRLTNSKQAVAVFITTESPISFDAIDNRPVDIFVALFVPEDCCKDHLSTLQNIAQLFSDKKIVKNIRKCQDNHQLFDIIQEAS